MAEPNERDKENFEPNQEKAVGAAAGAPSQTEAQGLKAQTGGPQEDQITGQTAKGADTQAKENRNPSFNEPDRNQSERQEDNKL